MFHVEIKAQINIIRVSRNQRKKLQFNYETISPLNYEMFFFLGGFSVSEFRQVRSPHGFSCYLHLTFLSSRNNQIAGIAPAGIPCMGMRAGGRQNPLLPNALCDVQMHRRLPCLTRG